jgi:hypothetical protein
MVPDETVPAAMLMVSPTDAFEIQLLMLARSAVEFHVGLEPVQAAQMMPGKKSKKRRSNPKGIIPFIGV